MKQGLPNDLQQQVHIALQEDLSPSGCLNAADDLSAQLVPASARMHAEIIAREPGILCGCAWVDAVFAALGNTVAITQTTSTDWPPTSSTVGSPRPTQKNPYSTAYCEWSAGVMTTVFFKLWWLVSSNKNCMSKPKNYLCKVRLNTYETQNGTSYGL